MEGTKKDHENRAVGSSAFRLRKVPNQRCGSLSGIENGRESYSYASNENECEVIEIVSLDRTKRIHNINGSYLDSPADDDGNESDSNESVEILDSSQCSSKSSMEKSCSIHRKFEMKESQSSQTLNCRTKQKEVCIEASSMEDDEPVRGKTVNHGRQQKDKKRRRKYKILESEVKELKSLVNLLVSLKPQLVECGEWICHANKDHISFVLGSKEKAIKRKRNESRSQTQSSAQAESNNRIALIERLMTAACLELNMLPRVTKIKMKQKGAKNLPKHSKIGRKRWPVMEELNFDKIGV